MTHALILADHDTLARRLDHARLVSDRLFQLVDPDALYERPIPERHRLIFYLGHLEAFDWNLVARQACAVESFQPEFDRLFAFGIDPVDGGLPSEPASAWPARDQVERYNRRVREIVDACLAGAHPPVQGVDLATVFHMAIEHRLMHVETLAYLLHQLPYEMKRAPEPAPLPAIRTVEARTIAIPAGRATLGRRREDGFGWDNEFDEHRVEVPAFGIDVHKVTNRQFLEFFAAGGYDERRLWTDREWSWKEQHRIAHPAFWTSTPDGWRYQGMFESVPLPLDAPVYVSHAEASAFARWTGHALPSEAQFHRAAYGTPEGDERMYPWGDAAPEARHGNFDFHAWDPTPVGSHPDGDSAFGVAELVGNGWEWTRTVFAPFEGFAAHPFYAGYSANFFDGDHFVLKGGSPRTAACFLRRSFRNWFQPRYGYVYATFRRVSA